MSMQFVAIIPARYASTRFPGKPLALLGGKPIIQHVYERTSIVFSETFVATDDVRIYEIVEGFGGKAIMTSSEHQSGTDRCFEAYRSLNKKFDVIVNVQGDEPFIHTSQLHSIKECFSDASTQIATLVMPFTEAMGVEALKNPGSPKVVMDNDHFALYFSRSVIPFLRGEEESEWLKKQTYYKHIGLYAYKSDVLQKIAVLPQSQLERAESLEQLRWLQAGFKIKVGETDIETIGIDTPEDLQKANVFLNQQI